VTDFMRFTEENENEGETWNFWLQVDGNEAELDKLRRLLAEVAETVEWDLPYKVTGEIEPETTVDILVKYADRGYLPSHQKVVGKFTCPDTLDDEADALYKGRLREWFVEAK
jgi:hypothetical protein